MQHTKVASNPSPVQPSASTSILDFLSSERAALSLSLQEDEQWLKSFGQHADVLNSSAASKEGFVQVHDRRDQHRVEERHPPQPQQQQHNIHQHPQATPHHDPQHQHQHQQHPPWNANHGSTSAHNHVLGDNIHRQTSHHPHQHPPSSAFSQPHVSHFYETGSHHTPAAHHHMSLNPHYQQQQPPPPSQHQQQHHYQHQPVFSSSSVPPPTNTSTWATPSHSIPPSSLSLEDKESRDLTAAQSALKASLSRLSGAPAPQPDPGRDASPPRPSSSPSLPPFFASPRRAPSPRSLSASASSHQHAPSHSSSHHHFPPPPPHLPTSSDASLLATLSTKALNLTEQSLSDLRRRHAVDLQALTDAAATHYSHRVSDFESRAYEELDRSLAKRRDDVLSKCRQRVVAGLEVSLNIAEEEGRRRRKADREALEARVSSELRTRVAEFESKLGVELEKNAMRSGLLQRVKEIRDDNEKDMTRVFGELASALDNGAKKNLKDLEDGLSATMREKEASLVAHGEGVVAEAMKRISEEMAEGERADLVEIRHMADEKRIEQYEKTRLEGLLAVDKALEAEKTRIREKRERAVVDLRQELQARAVAELQELQDAMEEDLDTAEGLMIESVRAGLEASISYARENVERRKAAGADDGVLQNLRERLRIRQRKYVSDLPVVVAQTRLRHITGAPPISMHAGGNDDDENIDSAEEGADGVQPTLKARESGGGTKLSLHMLKNTLDDLQQKFEVAAGVLAKKSTEVKELRKEMKSVDEESWRLFYGTGGLFSEGGKDESKQPASDSIAYVENILEWSSKLILGLRFTPEDGHGGGGGGTDSSMIASFSNDGCLNCKRLYKENGELLREINQQSSFSTN